MPSKQISACASSLVVTTVLLLVLASRSNSSGGSELSEGSSSSNEPRPAETMVAVGAGDEDRDPREQQEEQQRAAARGRAVSESTTGAYLQLDPVTGDFNVTREVVDEVRRCLRNSGNLFLGHSHIGAIGNAFCQLLGFDLGSQCREKAPPLKWRIAKNGLQTWTDDATRWSRHDRINWRRSMDPYLTLQGRIRKNGKKKRPGSSMMGQRYDNIFVGTAMWDLIYRNTHPEEVFQRTLDSLKRLIPQYNNFTMQSTNGNNATTRLGSAASGNTMIVYLPHFHRSPSWPSRVPCHASARVLAYHAAVEAAAAQFQEHLNKLAAVKWRSTAAAAKPFSLKLLVFDVYEWTRDHLTQPRDYLADGNHLSPERSKNLAVALLLHANNPLCGPSTQKNLLRVLSGVKIPSLLGESVLRAPRTSVLAAFRRTTRTPGGASLLWPSLPSCETHRGDLDSFYHSSGIAIQRRPGWNYRWSHFKLNLVRYYLRKEYPTTLALRAQLVYSILGGGASGDDSASGRVLECFRNMGLSENATTWDEPVGNPDFLVLRRKKQSPSISARVPSCTCTSATSLFPSIQNIVLKSGVTSSQISDVCQERVKEATLFLQSSPKVLRIEQKGTGKDETRDDTVQDSAESATD